MDSKRTAVLIEIASLLCGTAGISQIAAGFPTSLSVGQWQLQFWIGVILLSVGLLVFVVVLRKPSQPEGASTAFSVGPSSGNTYRGNRTTSPNFSIGESRDNTYENNVAGWSPKSGGKGEGNSKS